MGELALVTGGSRGIGRAIVERLDHDGWDVATCGRGERPDGLPERVLWIRADVSRTGDAQRLVADAQDAYGPVRLLVNNAGIQVERTVLESTDADWDSVVGINCRGVFTMCRAALPAMLDDGGVIVNIASVSGLVADASMALYNASKAFVIGLTRSIAVDHGPAVRAVALCPGWIETELADAAFALAADPAAARAEAVARHPVRRLGRPDDVAAAVAWVAGAEAGFVTGQAFVIDGGLTAASPLRPDLS